MGKIFKKAAIGILVLAIIGTGTAWYIAAGNAISRVEAMILAFNGKKQPDGSTIRLSYASLSRAGFPAIGVRMVNPVIDITATDPNGQPIALQWKREGTDDIITDYLNNEYRFVSHGSSTGFLETPEGKTRIALSDSRARYALKAKTRAIFDAWGRLDIKNQKQVTDAIKGIAEIHADIGPLNITDIDSGATLFTQEQTTLDLVNRSTDAQIRFSLAMLAKGSEMTQHYGELMQRISQALKLKKSINDADMPLSMARAGKQDFELDMDIDMPVPGNGPMPNGEIHVRKLYVANNYYTISAPFDVVLKEAEMRRNAQINLDWSFTLTPTGGEEMARFFTTNPGISDLVRRRAKEGTVIEQEALAPKIIAALPTISTVSPVTLKLDFTASVPDPKVPEPKERVDQEKLDLKRFAFSHARWGLNANGTAVRDTRNAMSVDGKLICRQCGVMTQDMFQTANAVQDLFTLLTPDRAQWQLTESWLSELDAMLAMIGEKDATGDITYTITSPSPNDIRINGRRTNEALPHLMQLLTSAMPPRPAPALPKSAPPSPTAKPVPNMLNNPGKN